MSCSVLSKGNAWDRDKMGCIDWSDADDILANQFTFFELLSLHPALAEHYRNKSTGSGKENIEKENKIAAERKYLKELFQVSVLDAGGAATTTASNDKKRSERVETLRRWLKAGLLTLRDARWCRECGGEGHTKKSCSSYLSCSLSSEAQLDQAVGDGNSSASPSTVSVASVCPSTEVSKDENEKMSVLERFQAHQEYLEKQRLIQEKLGKGATGKPLPAGGRALVTGGRDSSHRIAGARRNTLNERELELFSDERRCGVVEKLELSHNIGFIRASTGSAACSGTTEFKFFIDRFDAGVKVLSVGDRVSFKVDHGREYPMAVDVREEQPTITAEDVQAFLTQCRAAAGRGTTIDCLCMLVSHPSEWQDVLRHIFRHREGQKSFLLKPWTAGVAFESLLPIWVSQVQTLTELTTFYTNREPVNKSILSAFLKLLSTPVSLAKPSAASSTTPLPSSSIIRFYPDLFSDAIEYIEAHVIPTYLGATDAKISKKENICMECLSHIADSLCEAADLVALIRHYVADPSLDDLSQRIIERLIENLQELLQHASLSASTPVPIGNSPSHRYVRRINAALTRLRKVDGTAAASPHELTMIPSMEEIAIPPPHVASCFHPSRLPMLAAAAGGSATQEASESASPHPCRKACQTYESVEALITAHCELLRADTFEATTRVLAGSCFQLEDYPPDEDTKVSIAHAALYNHVRFMGRVVPRDRDYSHPTGYLFQLKPNSRHASFATRLNPGTCVCFVTAVDEKSILPPSKADAKAGLPVPEVFWGIISSCDAELLRANIVCVSPCNTNSTDAAPAFSLLLENLSRNEKLGHSHRNIMLETRIFYAGYAAIMNSLKTFLGPLAVKLPLHKRILGPLGVQEKHKATPTPAAPPHSLLGYIPPQCGQAFKEIIASICHSCHLDEGQNEVMHALPHQNVLLVQGPPGTGKSFTGCRVVEAYVRYKQMISSGELLQRISISELGALRKPSIGGERGSQQSLLSTELLPQISPIVVITYKNHALDEFLVDLLNCNLWASTGCTKAAKECFPSGKPLVRIGGRSRESRLDPYNLSSLMRDRVKKTSISRYREHIGVLHQRLDRLTKEIQHLENGRVPKAYFEKWLTEEQRRYIKFEEREEWLQGGRYIGEEVDASSIHRNYFKTILKSSLMEALESAQSEASAALESAMVPPAKRSSEPSSEDAPIAKIAKKEPSSEETEEMRNEIGLDVGSSAEIAEEPDDVIHSIFQEMKREDEKREFNNRLHSTALSPEAIYLAHHPPSTPPAKVPSNLQSLWSLDPLTRHHYYAYLIQKTIAEKANKCFHIMAYISNFLTIRNHELERSRLSLLNSADVVGLTTTGCAMHQDLLRSLRPSVLVVEEAAEVLESQLLACFTDSLQQIILIGDHFQLQPKVETFMYEKVNRMNLSLFERLTGHIPVIRLTEQRRMHPELSCLVRPLYPNQSLLDHPLLLTRPLITASGRRCIDHVPGLAKRVFFWSHHYPEETAPGGSLSSVNRQEVEMTKALVKHLVSQGVFQRSITVITPYAGQCRLLRSNLRLYQLPEVRVSTVDLYQGDENDIVILSLVRTSRLTEFLRMRNRLVVSCSRARYGMVLIGSPDLLRKSKHWADLLQLLEEKDCVGDRIPIANTVENGASSEKKMDNFISSSFLSPEK